MGSDPWRTDGRRGADGGHGHRQETGAYRSPEEGYRRREDRSRGRGLEELFSGRQGNLDVDGEDEVDSANRVRETTRDGETKGDDESQEQGAGEQRDMPAGVHDGDSAQTGMAAEPSTAETNGKGGTRDLPRDGEKGDGGGRGGGARSPDPRRQRDEGHGDGARSPDLCLSRDGGCGGGARSPEPRLNRAVVRASQIGGRIVAGKAMAVRARQTHDVRTGTRGTEVAIARRYGSSCMKKGTEAATARLSHGSSKIMDAGELGAHRISGGITTGEAKGNASLQALVILVMRDAEAATARLTCNGTMERDGKARRARPTGTGNLEKAGEADTGHSLCNRAGMGGAAVGITHLSGTGSMMEDVPVRKAGVNATAGREVAG
ncbi:unnamed protein product [Closterium sp. Yama58-4]|nr:unnamed protein product [Closterium sp. Yama58-4]